MAVSKEVISSGHILLMDAQDKWRWSTDNHRHSSEVWWLEAEILVKELGGAVLDAKQMRNALFTFRLYLKILFRFLSASENEYWHRSFVKATWYKVNFWKEGDSCRLNSGQNPGEGWRVVPNSHWRFPPLYSHQNLKLFIFHLVHWR